jgi:tRNA 2-thiouridine synthesizing protein A
MIEVSVNTAEVKVNTFVDARNQPCPKPILMTKRALEKAQLGEVLEIVVNDHTSKGNVLRYCWNHGQEIIGSREEGPDFHLIVRKSPERKVDKPLPVIGPCGQRWD